MTLTTPYSATFQVGDGLTKTFPYLFEEVSSGFVSVMVYNPTTDTTTIPTFTVDTDQKQVIFGDETPAPTADEVVCIYRNTPEIQDVEFRTLQGYNAKTMENILSKIVAMIQELKSNYFSTQVLQGDPWQLDLLSSADDGATVNIDYTAKKLVKGLYFRITSGNLQVSADGSNFITMPKSADISEFRQISKIDSDGKTVYILQYKIGSTWFNAGSSSIISSSDMDGVTIKKNSDGKYEAQGVKNRNNTAGATKIIYDWVGTEAEYYDQDVENNHPDWLCYITDDAKELPTLYITVDYNLENERLVITSGGTGAGTKISQANYSSTYNRLILS